MYDGNDVLLPRVVIMVDVVIPLTSNAMVGDGMGRSILLVAALAGTNILTFHLMVISNLTRHTRCWQTVVRYNILPDPTTMSEAV
jgi:hypothetical protein